MTGDRAATAQSPGTERRSTAGRPRDAAASKAALLQAAQQLFGRKGFEGTTLREIGTLAGVDAALIARYFGSKADLYVAAVVEEDQGEAVPSSYTGLRQMADVVVSRADHRGPGPILQAMIRADTSAEIREAALDRLRRRLVEPLAAGMADRQVERAQLRAEVTVSALFGISLGRSLGWFEELGSVSKDELVALVAATLGEVIAGPAGDRGTDGVAPDRGARPVP